MSTSALEALRDVLVPPRCAGCGGSGSWFCVACRDAADVVARTIGTLRVTAAGAHEGPLREAIHRLKYQNEPGLAAELGALVASRIAVDIAAGVQLDAIVPVPLHPARKRERGYDQSRALAIVAAAATGLPVRSELHRLRQGPAQATLGQRERQANIRGAFAGVAGSLQGLHIAVIDDVVTTGATLLDAAAAVRACGARGVRGYAVALEE